jgi:hypothetical protein
VIPTKPTEELVLWIDLISPLKTVQGKASVIAPSGQACTIVSVRKAVSIRTL